MHNSPFQRWRLVGARLFATLPTITTAHQLRVQTGQLDRVRLLRTHSVRLPLALLLVSGDHLHGTHGSIDQAQHVRVELGLGLSIVQWLSGRDQVLCGPFAGFTFDALEGWRRLLDLGWWLRRMSELMMRRRRVRRSCTIGNLKLKDTNYKSINRVNRRRRRCFGLESCAPDHPSGGRAFSGMLFKCHNHHQAMMVSIQIARNCAALVHLDKSNDPATRVHPSC